jgi:hypothetical protein
VVARALINAVPIRSSSRVVVHKLKGIEFVVKKNEINQRYEVLARVLFYLIRKV